ncbi:MAG: helicase-related protein, partial [Candidatus Dormibacteraceae bacterium]
FSSTRELAGMRRLVDDDIAERTGGPRARTQRRRPLLQELTSRMPSNRIAQALAELERSFEPSYDSTAALDALRKELREDREGALKRLERREQPTDVLLATSMLQVGVDVQRLGLMVVTGQPKNTAEYIQATSRIGRDPQRPGVVFTIYQWSRPRDLAHYEDFVHYHDTFGARVEGLTTTPFSDRALDRGLTGVLVSCMRQDSPASLANSAAQTVDLDAGSPRVKGLVESIVGRAELVLHDVPAAYQVRQRLTHRLERWAVRREQLKSGILGYQPGQDVSALLRAPEEGDWDMWTVPRSMREVEPEILLQLRPSDHSLEAAPAWHYQVEAPK